MKSHLNACKNYIPYLKLFSFEFGNPKVTVYKAKGAETICGNTVYQRLSKSITQNHMCVRIKMQLQVVFASIVKWLGCPPCIYGAHCKLAEPELRGFFFDIVHSTHSLIIGIYANQKVRTNALFSLGMPFCNVRKFTRITQRKKGVIFLHERVYQ